jgi:hypothetical protein
MLDAMSSHRPETVGGADRAARGLLHPCSNAEEDSGGTGLGVGFLRGMGWLSFVALPRWSPFMLIARAGICGQRPSTARSIDHV